MTATPTAKPYTRTRIARNYAIKFVLLKRRERRVIETGTEKTGRSEDQRRALRVRRCRERRRRKGLKVHAMRTAETVVDMLGRLGGNLAIRTVLERGAGAGRKRARALVIQGAQTRVAQVRCRPEQQEHRDRMNESTVPPPAHRNQYSRPSHEGLARLRISRCERAQKTWLSANPVTWFAG